MHLSIIKNHDPNEHDRENDDDNGVEDDENASYDDPPVPNVQLQCVNTVLNKEDMTELAASTIAKMKASSSVVQSTIDHLVCESSDLFSQVIMSLKTKMENVLESRGVPENNHERQNLLEEFNILLKTWKQLTNKTSILGRAIILYSLEVSFLIIYATIQTLGM